VSLLIDKFIEQINSDAKGRPETQEKKISTDARNLLLAHGWPGNVRELYHSLLRAAIWSREAEITAQDVSTSLLQVRSTKDTILGRPITQGFDLQGLLDDVSRDYVARALVQTGDRKAAAAKLLGFGNHQTLSNWMKRLGITNDQQDD
jgi:DNA-binding NtrC family response regulator